MMKRKKSYYTGREIEIFKELGLYDGHPGARKVQLEDIDSRVEYDFVHEFQKHCRYPVYAQQRVDAKDKYYVLDFLVEHDDGNFGIEIDGKEWHSIEKDSQRDIDILENSEVDVMIRFHAADVHYNPAWCVFMLLKMCPPLFQHKGRGDWIPWRRKLLKNKLRLDGVINYTETHTEINHGYKERFYEIEFITWENYKKYDIERESYPESKVDIHDYTYKRETSIKTMVLRSH